MIEFEMNHFTCSNLFLPLLSLMTRIVLFDVGQSVANQVHTYAKRIPIGALFSSSPNIERVRTAFRLELERHNLTSQSSLFRPEKVEWAGDLTSSFEVSRAICNVISKGTFLMFGLLHPATHTTTSDFMCALNMPYITISNPSNYSFLSYYLQEHSQPLLVFPSLSSPTFTRDGGILQLHQLQQPHQLQPHQLQKQRQQPRPPQHNDDFILYMRPSYDRAMVDVILDYNWPKIFYVYDNFEGLYRLEKLYEIQNRPDWTLDIEPVRLADVDDSYMVLRQMDSHEPVGNNRYIVLDLSTEDALVSVLKQIQAVGMNRGGYHYLLGGIAFDEINIMDFKHGGVNITGFTLINRNGTEAALAQVAWEKLYPSPSADAENKSQIKLEAALAMDAVSVITRALGNMLTENQDEFRDIFRRGHVYSNDNQAGSCRADQKEIWSKGVAIMEQLKQVYFPGITGMIAFDESGHRRDYTLAIYELNLNSNIKEIATWHYSSGLTKVGLPETTPVEEEVEPEPVNKTRIVTTIISPPFLNYKKRPEGAQNLPLPTSDRLGANGLEKFEGYCAELTVKLAGIVKFEFELRLVRDETYGVKIDNGTWNGMVGELATRKADVSVAPLTISSIRERVIDFSKPFMNLGISIMIKKPEKQKPGVFSFMDPLAYDIWACIVISYLAVSFVLFLVSRFSPYEWQMDDTKDCPDPSTAVVVPSYTNDFTVLNSLWFSLAAFMRQGCDISPRSLSGRVVGSAWWFFTLIIISSYTANLAAFLTIERMLTPIECADDLAKQREILYGTLDSGSTKDFFRNSKISTYEIMWDFMINNPDVFVKTTEDGVARVRSSKGKYAFLVESTMNDYYNQKKPCNTMKVGGDLDSKGYGVATPIGSDLREPIGLAILQLLEMGDLAKLHKKWWYDKGECVPEDTKGGSSSQSALTLSNVAGIFYILIGGLGLSMLTSLLEFIYKSKSEILKQKTFAESTRPKTRMSTGSPPDRENGGVSKGTYPLSPSTQHRPLHQQLYHQPPDDSHHLLHHPHPHSSAPDETGYAVNQRPTRTAIVLV